MSNEQLKAYKYRFHPTDQQVELLAQSFGCARYVFNRGLASKKEAYDKDGTSLSYGKLSSSLTEWKKSEETSWLKDVSSVCLQQSLRHLDTAFKNFFNKTGQFPRFKKRQNRQSITLMKSAFKFTEGELRIAKSKDPLKIKWSRRFTGEPSSLTISKTPSGKYFVSFLVKEVINHYPKSAKELGIDLGIKEFLTDSDENQVSSVMHLKKSLARLKKLQTKLSSKQSGSNNYKKLRLKLAIAHERIANKRQDFLHKLSTKIVRDSGLICVEDLAVKRMLEKSHPELSRLIADSGWRLFLNMLEYKCSWYGRSLVKVDQFFPSSQLCSTDGCSYQNKGLQLSHRSWKCPQCGTDHDRDVNAAINIRIEGHRLFKETQSQLS